MALADALSHHYLARIACSLDEIRDEMGSAHRIVGVVCVPSRKLPAHEVHDEALRIGVPRDRVVFFDLQELEEPAAIENAVHTLIRFDGDGRYTPYG